MPTEPQACTFPGGMKRSISILAGLGAVLALGAGGAGAQAQCPGADAGPGAGPAVLAEALECLLAQERAAAGVPPLAVHGSLMRSAQAHAADMVDRRYLASRSPEGSTPVSRATQANYVSDSQGIKVGEAFTFGEGPAATPRSALNAWKADEDFRAVVLDPEAQHIGVGVVQGAPFPVDAAAATYVADIGSQLRPEIGRTVVAGTTRGVVMVRSPGAKRFFKLKGRRKIRIGSVIDARRGRVRLTSAKNSAGRPQTADFYEGAFTIIQRRRAGGSTDIRLVGALDCKPGAKASAAAKKAKRKRKKRVVWGSGKGKFRTRGRYATATVVGTRWKTEDTCAGTRITVASGVVTVRDLRRKRTVRLRAGDSILIRARRR